LREGEPRTTHCLYEVKQSIHHDGIWLPTKCACTIATSAGTRTLGGNLRIVDGNYIIVASNGSDIGTNKIDEPHRFLAGAL
jgi:hypothetical protein